MRVNQSSSDAPSAEDCMSIVIRMPPTGNIIAVRHASTGCDNSLNIIYMMDSKLTYDQKRDVARWLAKHNNGAVTGSIMLMERGCKLSRGINDIDIVLKDTADLDNLVLPPLMNRSMGGGHKGYFVSGKYEYMGLYIDFIRDTDSWERSDVNQVDDVRYCIVEDALKAKEEYVESNSNVDYIAKCKADIKAIKEYQGKFPFNVYDVSDDGIITEMTCVKQLSGIYTFKCLNCKDRTTSILNVKEEDLYKYHKDYDSAQSIAYARIAFNDPKKDTYNIVKINGDKANVIKTYLTRDDAEIELQQLSMDNTDENIRYEVRPSQKTLLRSIKRSLLNSIDWYVWDKYHWSGLTVKIGYDKCRKIFKDIFNLDENRLLAGGIVTGGGVVLNKFEALLLKHFSEEDMNNMFPYTKTESHIKTSE